MSSITKSIQNEYVLLIENAFSEKYKYAFRNLELKELRRFILKELVSSPELDNQLTNLIVLLNKFWDTHAAALITEVRASKSYRLLLPIQRFGYNISNHLRSLGIYFDSIIMVDPLHFPSLSSLHSFLSLPPDNSYVRMRRLVLLEHVSNLFRAIPFMTIDDDYPIFLIVPSSVLPSSMPIRNPRKPPIVWASASLLAPALSIDTSLSASLPGSER